jgi:glutamate-1-semialdehyde 2,1-aminomutase
MRRHDLACVILEPMLGGGGCIRATDAFLAMLRRVTQDTGALLVFDEVMTSRLSPGGLQAVTGITPDLMTLGKYLGGGASFGAFGGRAEIMDRFDPAAAGALGHAGTFNNNVLSMAAGLAGATQVLTPAAQGAMNALGEAVQGRLRDRLTAHGVAGTVTGFGSLFTLHFHADPTPASVAAADTRPLRLWHMDMLLAGQYATPRGMMALALPHGAAEAESLVTATDRFLAEHRAVLPRAA